MTKREFRQARFWRPRGACELLLVRHGESMPKVEGEPFPMVDGQGDPPLDPHGEVQAGQVADRLIATGEPIGAVYVTTMQRTHQTAAPLLDRLGVEARVEPDLREVHLGEWEGGLMRQKVADADPISTRIFSEQRWDVIPGAEPAEAFEERLVGAVGRIAERHPDEVVVIVAHGGVIGQILATASGARGFAFGGADNGSISHVVVTGGRWIVRCFNDTSHLSPTFTTTPEPLI